jgi:hypothetical protein
MTPRPEVVPHAGWERCLRWRVAGLEVIATLDVGPRIIHFGHLGGPNLLVLRAGDEGCTGGEPWRFYGGHRLWMAPEDPVLTYEPDNLPIEWTTDGDALVLRGRPGPLTGVQRTIRLQPVGEGALRLGHELLNTGPTTHRDVASWAITAMRPGGTALVPQEPFRPHPDALLPARPLVLWPFTNMADPRVEWGRRLIRLRQDPSIAAPFKFGVANSARAAAYHFGEHLFVKRAGILPGEDPAAPGPVDPALQPDMGCSMEFFTCDWMLELESLGRRTDLPPGTTTGHEELWSIARAPAAGDEEAILALLGPPA